MSALAQHGGPLVIADFAEFSKRSGFTQRLSYNLERDTVFDVIVTADQIRSADTVRLYSYRFERVKFKSGANALDLKFKDGIIIGKQSESYFEILRQFRTIPAGSYQSSIQLRGLNDTVSLRFVHMDFIDSLLPARSGLKTALEHRLSEGVAAGISGRNTRKATDAQLAATQRKVNRSLRPVKGMESHTVKEGSQSFSEIRYKEFFVGKYRLSSLSELKEKISSEQDHLSSMPGSGISNDLTNFSGVSAQMRELSKNASREKKYKGFIDVSTNRANAQDPASVIDQNYTEVLANLDVDLMGIPFNIEGFYTTQDANRKAKASYFRFHYDINAAKQKMQQQISAYQSKLKETEGKGAGMQAVYGSFTKSLIDQQSVLLKSLVRETGIDSATLALHNGNLEHAYSDLESRAKDSAAANGGSDSAANARYHKFQERRKNALSKREELEKRYERATEMARKADRYEKLLENYRNKTVLDSAIMANRSKYLDKSDPSYKDLARSAEGILPEGNTKRFLTGLSHFDAGIINKYESNYTMSGQNLKGFSIGYEAGPVTTGLTMGSTEYVSRDGNVDHYSTMLLRVDNNTSEKHKVSFLYNLTMPAKSMTVDERFIGKNSAQYPSFTSPTQIPALTYDGRIGKLLTLHTELATSIKRNQQTMFDMEHAAITTQGDFLVPRTSVSLNAAWEHLGKSFENNALPYIRSGSERYTLGTSFDVFKGFLSAKVEYNYLVQQNLSSNAYSRKWGIDLKTHSKRYPSVGISYKPFSTFRAANDTLAVPQRPVQGEVWTVRASYQLKRHKIVHRFTTVWNRNRSTADTLQLTSETAQLSYILTMPKLSATVGVGRMVLPDNMTSGNGEISSYTSMLSVQKPIGKSWNVGLSPSIAWTDWGVQRSSTTISVSWAMQRKPLTLRLAFRQTHYRLKAGDPAQDIYLGQLGLNYKFSGVYRKKTITD